MQVELRRPLNFHDVAIYAERADAILSRVSGQDSGKNWHKQQKGGQQQRPIPMKTGGETSGGTSGGPKPMEIGTMNRRPLSKEEYQKLQAENACFYCRKPNPGHMACDYPLKKKRQGNRGSH